MSPGIGLISFMGARRWDIYGQGKKSYEETYLLVFFQLYENN